MHWRTTRWTKKKTTHHDHVKRLVVLAQRSQLHDVGVLPRAQVHLHLVHRVRRPRKLLHRHRLAAPPSRVHLPLRPRACASKGYKVVALVCITAARLVKVSATTSTRQERALQSLAISVRHQLSQSKDRAPTCLASDEQITVVSVCDGAISHLIVDQSAAPPCR